ncbi:MAG: SufD family Fe-S cluster assembly protein [Marinicella sp.]
MVGLIHNWTEDARLHLSASNDPHWLSAKRQLALKQLQTLHDPSRKLELWRYADVSRLNSNPDQPSRSQQLTAADVDPQDTVIILSENGLKVVGDSPNWLSISSINSMSEKQWVELDFAQETAVNLANTVLFRSGVFIQVKDTHENIHIRLVYQFSDSPNWRYIRNQIEVAGQAKVTVTEQHVAGHINTVNVYKVAEAGKLERQHQIKLNKTDKFISYNQFEVNAHAKVTNMCFHTGGLLQHHQHVVNFNRSNSQYISGSINKSYDNNNITDVVRVNHNEMNNLSDVTHRSIATDQSQIFNNAKALVAVGADHSEIEQDLKNILLSPDAKIFSKPELEVYADEVVAAHGSTIGALDDTALFYLQSRGVDLAQAREIMIESFEQEAVVC